MPQQINGPLLNMTREESVHRAHAKAVERMKRLEIETESTFREYKRAQELMKQLKLETTLGKSRAVEAGWLAWNSGGADSQLPEYVAPDYVELPEHYPAG